jgi:hypothetical protein
MKTRDTVPRNRGLIAFFKTLKSDRRRVSTIKDVPDATIQQFSKLVDKLERVVLPKSYEGDSPVQVVVVDRRLYEHSYYFPIRNDYSKPRLTDEEWDARGDDIVTNLQFAMNAMERHNFQTKCRRQEKKKREG